MQVEILPAGDNFIYLIHDSGLAAVIDPTESKSPIATARTLGLELELVLLTHHHADHTGGCPALKRAGCTIVGPADQRFSHLDRQVSDGDHIALGSGAFEVISVPGHTNSHVAYYSPRDSLLFSGDTLFACGCGRLFEGTPEEMWNSLQKLRKLPDKTQVYSGHDYTLENLEFAADLDPDNTTIRAWLAEVRDRIQAGLPTVPSLLGREKAANPFLRADSEGVAEAVGLAGSPSFKVFAEIRRRKDGW